MPIGFEPGGTGVEPYELQRMTEDAFVEASALLDQQHDSQGGHTDVTVNALSPNDTELIEVAGGLRYTLGPWVLEPDGNNPGLAVVQPVQITANQNNYNPPDLANAIVLELESDAPRILTGLVTVRRRRLLLLVNRGNHSIRLARNDAGSTSTYRFGFGSSIASGGTMLIYYDAGSEIWRGGREGGLASVQYGTITFTNGGSNAPTATITSVDTSRSVLHHLGHSSDTDGFSARLTLTGATTVTGTRDNAFNAASAVVSFLAAEFN